MYNDITGKGNKIAAILEWFETLMEMLCMLCLVSFYLYRRLMTAGGEGASGREEETSVTKRGGKRGFGKKGERKAGQK